MVSSCIAPIMLGIFSLAYWPLTHLIWRNVYLNNQKIPCYYNFVVENHSKIHQSTFTLNQCICSYILTLSACWCWRCWALRMPSKPQGFSFLYFSHPSPDSSGHCLCRKPGAVGPSRAALSGKEVEQGFSLCCGITWTWKRGIKAQSQLLHWGGSPSLTFHHMWGCNAPVGVSSKMLAGFLQL